jgi:hypothetical protein
MANLIQIRHESSPITRDTPSCDVPSAGEQAGTRHSARHARSSGTGLSGHLSLAIRSAEARSLAAELSRPSAPGLVVYGMGGIGKSTLAGQIAPRVGGSQAGRVVAVVDGEISPADLAAGPPAADFIIFRNFDDNLSQETGQWAFRDPALATLLTNWTGKLLITCRHPFALPAGPAPATPNAPWLAPSQAAPDRLVFRQLGPLTRSGAAELTASLPALRLLPDSERDGAWRLTAGHPLAIKYLDSLLGLGERYPAIAARVEAMIEARTGQSLPSTEPTELPAPAAELVACAARDQLFGELFDRLSDGARALLVRASVFRLPVAAQVVAGRASQIAECEAVGLLAVGDRHELAVHRWTADALHRRLAEAGLGAQVAAAHRRAARHWQARAAGSPSPHRARLEAGHHQREATPASPPGDPANRPPGRGGSTGRRRPALTRAGRRGVTGAFLVGALATLSVVLTIEATGASSVSHLTSAAAPARVSARDPARSSAQASARMSALVQVSEAVAVRAEAAAWAASQVGAGAIMACDPAMCAVLAQHGIAVGSLLALRPGTADPLGSDVVLATAAVRDMFGARLASVYAPELLASFGTGQARIDIRAVAPDGAATYQAAIAADLQARRRAGSELVRDPMITFGPAARAQLAAGQVDARLLTALDTLAASEQVRITAFSDDGPGAGPDLPLRAAELTASNRTAVKMLAFFRAQRPPYLVARAAIAAKPGGESVLTVEFAAPAPLGLLQPQS